MNDLTTNPQSSLPSRQTWSALSAPLKGLLLAGSFSAIADAPAMLAEVEQALPELRREATRAATRAEIMAVLSQRFAVYPQPERTDGEWSAWWGDYVNALDDLPPSAIEAGMAAYVKGPDSEFFPKPGKIRELAKTSPNRLAAAVQTGQRAIACAQGRRQEAAPVAEPAPTASVAELMADFAKQMAARNPAPTPTRPPVSGPVDGSGITQAMRDRMARDRT